jgi:hypothetical protein
MNMLELQLLIVVSGVPERRIGPTLVDSSGLPGLLVDLQPQVPAKISAASDHTPPKAS